MEEIAEIREHLAAIETLLKKIETPFKVTTLQSEAVELEGTIGRPETKTVKGKTLFTAGLKIQEGNVTRWVPITAWNDTAQDASILIKGDRVRVVGRFKENRYLDNEGIMKVKTEILASLISPVVGASSEITS